MSSETRAFPADTIDFNEEIEFTRSPSLRQWREWRALCESEQWTMTDHSVAQLLPLLSNTYCLFAVRKSDGSVLGACVWSEYADLRLTYVASYIMTEQVRGLGVGSRLTRIATTLLNPNYPTCLNAVPSMDGKYSIQFPIREMERVFYRMPVDQLSEALRQHVRYEDTTTRLISSLTPDEFERALAFDRAVCRADRSEMLRMHWRLDCTEGAVQLCPRGNIRALCGVCRTCAPSRHLWRVGPVYADDLAAAAAVLLPVLRWCKTADAEASCVVHVYLKTRGDRLLSPLLSSLSPPTFAGVREFNAPHTVRADMDRVLVAHCHAGYLDV